MNTNFESGHGKNVANFGDLLGKITLLGDLYNPSNPLISLTALNQKLNEARADIVELHNQSVDYFRDTNERQALYKDTLPYVTRIIRSLSSAQVSKETLKDAKRIQRKISGARAKAIAEAPPNDPNQPAPDTKTISVSQRSYDSQALNFSLLETMIRKEDKYNPNEEDLKKEVLSTHLKLLSDSNEKVKLTASKLNAARASRNTNLYLRETGIADLVQTIKSYVRSLKKIDSEIKADIMAIPIARISTKS